MSVTAIHLIIHGRVQGVGYRAWAASRARQLGLNGWVRNRCEGTVEAIISGDSATVATMVEACHEGPLAARVRKVEATPWIEPVAEGFTHKETI